MMASGRQFLIMTRFILLVTSQIDISQWKHYQQVATLSPKEDIVVSQSRIACATLCEHRNCDSFVYGDDKICQAIHSKVDELALQKGELYEHWVRSKPKTQGSNAGTLFLSRGNYLYWFDISTRERIAKVRQQDKVSHCVYDAKRRMLFWAERNGPMKCAQLSLGKVGPAKRILRKPVGHFCMDFDKTFIFFSNAPSNEDGDFIRYSRKTRKRKTLKKNTDEYRMWWCSVDSVKQYIFYGETDTGILRVDYNGDNETLFQETDVNTVLFNQDDQNLFWVDEYESDDYDSDLSRINYRNPYGTSVTKRLDIHMVNCYHIYVDGNVIYYKTSTARGVSVVTLDGTQLPSIGTKEITATDEPYIFLFK